MTTPSAISSSQALRFGWRTTCANVRPLLTLGLIGGFLELLQQALRDPAHAPGLATLLRLALQLVQAALVMVFLRVALQLHDGKEVDLSRPQQLLANYFGYLLTTVLLSLIVLGGLVLLIVPGVLWAVRFGFAPFLVVQGKLDPVAALRESSRLTQGVRAQLLGFALLVLVINLLGALTFGVGLLVTWPTGLIAAAYVMRQLQAHAAQQGPASEPPRAMLPRAQLPA